MPNVERITIENDGFGFELWIETDEDEPVCFNLGDHAETLYDIVKARIGPWLREREDAFAEFKAARARGEFHCSPEDIDESAGAYELNDPKHPRYHSVHVDLYDQREGK